VAAVSVGVEAAIAEAVAAVWVVHEAAVPPIMADAKETGGVRTPTAITTTFRGETSATDARLPVPTETDLPAQ